MQKREKILAGALGGTLVFWLGFSMFADRILKPLQELEGREIQLTKEKEQLFEQQLDLARKESEIKSWRALSLPPDPQDAQRLYQEWITTLALISGFEINKVSLDRRVAEADTYVTIPITIDAKAQLQELASFLERFESVQLLHRIARCDVLSPSNEGNPELTLTLTAEGLSLPSAPARPRLFPLTELAEPISRDTQKLTVVSSKGFPDQTPFCIRIGSEFLNVTAVDGNVWTVQRGVEKSFAEKHNASDGVEEFPLQARKESSQAVAAMWTRSIFTKPTAQVNYQPRLASTTPPVAIRGTNWTWKLDVSGWNPAFGSPKFEVLSAPQGMELDEKTGTFHWRIGEQAELGRQPIEILVWGTNGRDSGFTSNVNVRVRDPNLPPRFSDQKPLKFFIGRQSKVKIAAEDPDGDNRKLQYSLSDGPSGMSIDASTGELRWTPGEDLLPQTLSVNVQVQDGDEMPQTASQKFSIALEEDSAKYTYLTGSVIRSNGEKECLINDRVTNRSTMVKEGDHLEVADFALTVEKIESTFMLVKRDGRLFRWQFEQPLTEMTPVQVAERPREPVPVSADSKEE
ncbi:putative Ig domain-containing protein [Planctomicrobium sp. SH661]|uniref:putative Ig domain-containing protein n=1 Tax=Planctomicrobium sp. SH661 TaxID=3448124 RepID=UPI003F5C579C